MSEYQDPDAPDQPDEATPNEAPGQGLPPGVAPDGTSGFPEEPEAPAEPEGDQPAGEGEEQHDEAEA